MPRVSAKNAILLAAATHEPSPGSFHDTPVVAEAKTSLRRNWKWAYVSHFIFVFEPMLNLSESVSIPDLEDDLAAGTTAFVPRVLVRLLTCLTHDRKITPDNYQTILYRQYLRRAPELLPALVTTSSVDNAKSEPGSPSQVQTPGSQNEEAENENEQNVTERIEWVSLSLEQRLDILYNICEWQFTNPTRLRQGMKNDDEFATWRIEPLGYDVTLNAYYLLGGDRIWIQRALPKKPRVSHKKGKGKAVTKPKKAQKTKKVRLTVKPTKPAATPTANSRKRSAPDEAPDPQGRYPKRAKATKSGAAEATPSLATTRSGRPSRAAANDANKKLAALPQITMNPRSTRGSTRLRGIDHEELWQEIPPEWLHEDKDEEYKESSPKANGATHVDEEEPEDEEQKAEKDDIFGSDGSALTELSELTETEPEEPEEGNEEDEDEEEQKASVQSDGEDLPMPEGFIEWETIVITLQEWEAFPLKFEQSTNYREKALYKVLTAQDGVVYHVKEALRDVVRKKVQEEVLNNRKRSSRLAVKESEKEEARLAAIKKAEEDEKLERARRAEARAKKEEDARLKREEKREERRKALEDAKLAKELQEANANNADNAKDANVAIKANGKKSNSKAAQKARTSGPSTPIRRANGMLSGVSTPTGTEDWELDCEVCGARGINVNDGAEIACCELCGKWQHVWCHDQRDAHLRNPKRDWAKIEFRCHDCTRASRLVPHAPPVQQAKPQQGGSKLKLKATPQATVKPIPHNSTPRQPMPYLYPTNSLTHPSLTQLPQYPQNYPYLWPAQLQQPHQLPISTPTPQHNPAAHHYPPLYPPIASAPYYSPHPSVSAPTSTARPAQQSPAQKPITFAPNVSAENFKNPKGSGRSSITKSTLPNGVHSPSTSAAKGQSRQNIVALQGQPATPPVKTGHVGQSTAPVLPPQPYYPGPTARFPIQPTQGINGHLPAASYSYTPVQYTPASVPTTSVPPTTILRAPPSHSPQS